MLSPHEMETMLRNVDLRTTRLEQILPTLATKGDLSAAIALLATKDDLRTLATKEEVARLDARIEEVGRHAVILNEDVRGDVRMLAEHLAGVIERGFRKQ